MGIQAKNIFNMALDIMNEQADASAYQGRAVSLLNTLIGDCWRISEEHERGPHSTWTAIESLEDYIEGIDQTLALSAMPFGLAALLYIGEDPLQANSWQQIYEEQKTKCRSTPAAIERIEDVYGGIEYGQFGRW